MGQFAVQGYQPLSDAGAVLASGTLTFSRTGTSTAKAIYSNKALTSALSNPLTLDSAGRISTNIFLLEDEGYRVVLKNSAGTTIWTRDEVFALSLAVDEATRRKRIATSPIDYGAVGDGSTNDATALAAAIAAVPSTGGVLDLEGKTYRCDSSLSLKSGLTIRNGAISFADASAAAGLSGAGTAEATPKTISAASSQTFTVNSVSGLSATDLVRTRSSDVIAGTHKWAELFIIERISGTDVIVNGVLAGTYSTSPFLEKITAVSDVRLEDLRITAPNGGYAIDLDLCQRVRLSNVRWTSSANAESIRITSCYDVRLDGCSSDASAASEAGGVIIGDASRDIAICGCHFERALTPIDIGDDWQTHDGQTKEVTISDCYFAWCGQIKIGPGSRRTRILDCYMDCDIAPSTTPLDAILIDGIDHEICGNTIRNASGACILAQYTVSGTFLNITNNLLIGGTIAVQIADTTLSQASVEIRDNRFTGQSGCYVDVAGTALTRLVLADNLCRAGSGAAVAFDVTTADALTRCTISGNFIECGATYTTGISVSTSSGNLIEADGNKLIFTGASQTGILIDGTSVNRVVAVDNVAYSPYTGISIVAGGTSSTDIDGNKLEMHASATVGISIVAATTGTVCCRANRVHGSAGGAAGGKGILLDECLSAICNDNRINAVTIGIEIDNSSQEFSGVVVSGNHVIAGDTSIEVDASDATGSHSLAISGNYLESSGGASEHVILVTGIIVGVAINGNTCRRTNDTDANIAVTGDAAGNITHITIVGNVIHNGDEGIACTNNDAASTYHSANAFSSCAADDNGAGNFAVPTAST